MTTTIQIGVTKGILASGNPIVSGPLGRPKLVSLPRGKQLINGKTGDILPGTGTITPGRFRPQGLQSVKIPGSGSRIDFSSSVPLDLPKWTVAFWWWATDSSYVDNWAGPAQHAHNAVHNGFKITNGVSGGGTGYAPQINLFIDGVEVSSPRYSSDTTITVPFENWKHFAFTFNGGSDFAIYVDGVAVTGVAGATGYSGDWGSYLGYSYSYAGGLFEDFRVDTRAWNAGEVRALFRASKYVKYNWINPWTVAEAAAGGGPARLLYGLLTGGGLTGGRLLGR